MIAKLLFKNRTKK